MQVTSRMLWSLVLATAASAGLMIGRGGPARADGPTYSPGTVETSSREFIVRGPTVNVRAPESRLVIDTPTGPAVLSVKYVAQRPEASALAAAEGSATCVGEFRQPSFRLTIFTPWRWDNSSVTWMGFTSYSSFAVPLFWWDGIYTYNDWAPGWQYAWGNGRATMKYGQNPIGIPLFSVHVNTLVDAWGNCTPEVRIRWF